MYELRVFTPGRRKNWIQIKNMTFRTDDPHEMATVVWRCSHCETPYRCVILEWIPAGKGVLAPTISYETLVRRAGSSLVLPAENS